MGICSFCKVEVIENERGEMICPKCGKILARRISDDEWAGWMKFFEKKDGKLVKSEESK